MIKIIFRNGAYEEIPKSKFTDYQYDGKYFIVMMNEQWVGMYNLECIRQITVERLGEE